MNQEKFLKLASVFQLPRYCLALFIDTLPANALAR